jgi:hypothetical protein
VSRLDLEHAVADLENGDVKGPSTEVEHEDCLFGVLVEAVGQRGSRRLVDDSQHFEPGDLASFFGCLTLGVVEVRRNGHDRLSHAVTQVLLSVALELHQDASRDFLGRVLLAVDLDIPVGTDVALHRADRAVWVGYGLTLGDLTDQDFTRLGKRDDGRGRTTAFGVGNDDRLACFEH